MILSATQRTHNYRECDTQRNTVERPPSTPMTWPVIHEALSERRNAARFAESSGVPSRGMACAAAMAAAIFSLPVSGVDMALSAVRLGATQLTRTLGASSAESARVSPSTAPLLAEMTA